MDFAGSKMLKLNLNFSFIRPQGTSTSPLDPTGNEFCSLIMNAFRKVGFAFVYNSTKAQNLSQRLYLSHLEQHVIYYNLSEWSLPLFRRLMTARRWEKRFRLEQ